MLDPSSTLSFVTPLASVEFDVLPDVLVEPFSVFTLVDESVVSKRFYRSCPILLSNRVTLDYLVELDMLEFDVTLIMDWLNAFLASIDCRTRVVKFKLTNELVLELKEGNSIQEVKLFHV